MGLLKSVDNVPGIDFYEYRDSDYYNKYEYRARFKLVGVRHTWFIKADIQELVDRLSRPQQFYSVNYDREEALENIPTLDLFVKWRNASKKKKQTTIRIEHNTVAVFSNTLQVLKDIETAIPGLTIDYTQVQRANFVGIKHFVREPKHKFRVYLKSRRVESSFAQDLSDLLKKNTSLLPSTALKHWALRSKANASGWRYRYSSASHFIDYDDESMLSYLALMHGNMLGKRYKLEKRPD
jgi:hypothetical protein